MKRILILALAMVVGSSVAASGAVVAGEDFDGGALNLITSTVPALDGGAGDYFGVGSRNAWPQGFPTPGVPFGIGDDTVIGYCNGAPFATDNEGVYGQNSNLDNYYFAISDSDEFGAGQTASWTFDVSGFANLAMSVDMGGISSASLGGFDIVNTDVKFTAQIDAAPAQVVFDLDAIANPGYVTRPMDSGGASGGGAVLTVSGASPVTKYLAEDGSAATNTYLDKTPASGAGQGQLDTFGAPLSGSGSILVLTLTCNFPFEAMVFDNIRITGESVIPADQSTWGSIKALFD